MCVCSKRIAYKLSGLWPSFFLDLCLCQIHLIHSLSSFHFLCVCSMKSGSRREDKGLDA